MSRGLQAHLQQKKETSFGHSSNVYQIKASEIHGNGLFAKIDMKKNTIITYYDGETIDWTQAKARSDSSYIRSVSHGYSAIDGLRSPIVGKGAGSFVNHSPHPNAFFHIMHDIVFIKLKKDVESGEEILVSYGKTYWKQRE